MKNLIDKYIKRIKVDYPEDDKLMIDLEDFAKEIKEQLTIPVVSKSVVCGNCDGYGYTVDENGRRKEHCNECE